MTEKPYYDEAYKYLFGNRRIFYQLLKSFVPEPFVKDLQIEELYTVNKSFVSEEFLKRKSDIIYRVKRGKREIYIFILLEFQSTPDKFMAARLLSYIMRLYEGFMVNSRAGKLPAIFPIVLYNGQREWRAADRIEDLIERTISDEYIPRFKYFTIIEKDVPDEILFKLNNLIAAVIYLEKQRNTQKLEAAIARIVDMIKDEELIDVKQFLVWVNRMLSFEDKDDLIEEIRDMTEVKPMLRQLAEKIEAKGERKGERKKARETAKNLKNMGLSDEKIAEAVGLPLTEVDKL